MFRTVQTKIDVINRILRENLTGIRVVRAFVRTKDEEERFDAANADLTATTLAVTRLFALTLPAMMLIINSASVAIVWFGAHLIAAGEMQIGSMTAFLSYVMQILFAVLMAVMSITLVPRAAASAERMQAVLGTDPVIVDPATRCRCRARAPPDRPGPASSSSATWSSATRARRSRCSNTSRSRSPRA